MRCALKQIYEKCNFIKLIRGIYLTDATKTNKNEIQPIRNESFTCLKISLYLCTNRIMSSSSSDSIYYSIHFYIENTGTMYCNSYHFFVVLFLLLVYIFLSHVILFSYDAIKLTWQCLKLKINLKKKLLVFNWNEFEFLIEIFVHSIFLLIFCCHFVWMKVNSFVQ